MSSATLLAWETEDLNTPPAWGPTKDDCPEYPELEGVIERSAILFASETDDDQEASVEMKLGSFERAKEFLRAQSKILKKWYALPAPVPDIDLGPDGSADLHWKTSEWELLINIPADQNSEATFYGDTRTNLKLKGSFDSRHIDYGIALWLMKNQSTR